MKKWLIVAALISTLIKSGHAEVTIENNATIKFATNEQAREILSVRDEFIQRLSPFDRAARMKTDKDITEDEFVEFVATNTLAWSDEEKAIGESVFSSIKPRLDELSLPWPETIYMVKTTGGEEGGSAYTRGSAVILPQGMITPGREKSLRKVISHELFHILTRKNPALQEKLYAAIGFLKCKEIELPPKLTAIKITNPDAPRNDCCIQLKLADAAVWATPILFSRVEKYDAKRGGSHFSYMKFQFLVVAKDNTTVPPTMTYDNANPQLVDADRVSGFYEQVGRNTKYIIHPEEILADNFALLLQGEERVQSPEVLKQMKKILAENARCTTDCSNRHYKPAMTAKMNIPENL